MNKKKLYWLVLAAFLISIFAEGYRVFEFCLAVYSPMISALFAILVSGVIILVYAINRKFAIYYTVALFLIALFINTKSILTWLDNPAKPIKKERLAKVERVQYVTANRYWAQEIKYQQELDKQNSDIDKKNADIDNQNLEIDKYNASLPEAYPVDKFDLAWRSLLAFLNSAFFPLTIYISLEFFNRNIETKNDSSSGNVSSSTEVLSNFVVSESRLVQEQETKETVLKEESLEDKILRLFDSGHNVSEIARQCNTNRNRVYRVLSRFERSTDSNETPVNTKWTLGLEGCDEASI